MKWIHKLSILRIAVYDQETTAFLIVLRL